MCTECNVHQDIIVEILILFLVNTILIHLIYQNRYPREILMGCNKHQFDGPMYVLC